MLTKYIQTALRQAKHEILDDDGSFYGEIPAWFQGLRQRRNPGTMPGANRRGIGGMVLNPRLQEPTFADG